MVTVGTGTIQASLDNHIFQRTVGVFIFGGPSQPAPHLSSLAHRVRLPPDSPMTGSGHSDFRCIRHQPASRGLCRHPVAHSPTTHRWVLSACLSEPCRSERHCRHSIRLRDDHPNTALAARCLAIVQSDRSTGFRRDVRCLAGLNGQLAWHMFLEWCLTLGTG